MKKYVKATTYNRESVITRLQNIPGIHIISATDSVVVFKDKNNKEYSIQYEYNPEKLDRLFEQLEQGSEPYNLVDPVDLTHERLAHIVSVIADTVDNSSLGSTEQIIKISKVLRFYDIIR